MKKALSYRSVSFNPYETYKFQSILGYEYKNSFSVRYVYKRRYPFGIVQDFSLIVSIMKAFLESKTVKEIRELTDLPLTSLYRYRKVLKKHIIKGNREKLVTVQNDYSKNRINAKLNIEQVVLIKQKLRINSQSIRNIAKEFNVSLVTIMLIRDNSTWKDVI